MVFAHSLLGIPWKLGILGTASLVQLSSRGGTLHCIFPDMEDLSPGDAGGGGKKLGSVNWFVHLKPSDPGGGSRRQPHMGSLC